MFRLTRVYSITSLLGIAAIAVVLGIFHRTTAVEALIEHETQANVALAQAISNTLWPEYGEFVARAGGLPAGELPRRAEIARMEQDVRRKLQGLRIVRIKVFNLDGLTVFSTERRRIGEDKSASPDFQAARAGRVASEMVFRDHFAAYEGIIENRNIMSSYIPIRRAESGPVEGVFEVYTDVTALIAEINRTERKVLGVVTALMLALYLFLLAVIRRADRIIRGHEQGARRAQQERIDHLVHHDPLTGLANRAAFSERLHFAARLAERKGLSMGLMHIDLDRFKVINDSLGHEAGDRVLIESAARIRACLRELDTACRLGGDEFAVILENLPSPAEAALVAERLIGKFAEPMRANGHEVVVSPSIGITVYPIVTPDIERLPKDAEAAVRRAKVMGRNRYVFYTEASNAQAQASVDYELSLRRALRNREFLLYYQPQIDVASGRLIGLEALLRWRHPQQGLTLPGSFIPLLEDTGLIIAVGEWVIAEACRQCRSWHDAGHPGLRVAVNISPRQFRSESLSAVVGRALAASGLPPGCLELELTESVLIEDFEQAVSQMRDLKQLGVQLSIDDFGVGYSSLNYLRHLPIDALKIDRAFVREVTTNHNDAAITRAIIMLAKSLRLRIVAEGIETRAQADFLRHAGCELMQGYLFSEPVPADLFAAAAHPEMLRRVGLEVVDAGRDGAVRA